jgi:hypothetical protein
VWSSICRHAAPGPVRMMFVLVRQRTTLSWLMRLQAAPMANILYLVHCHLMPVLVHCFSIYGTLSLHGRSCKRISSLILCVWLREMRVWHKFCFLVKPRPDKWRFRISPRSLVFADSDTLTQGLLTASINFDGCPMSAKTLWRVRWTVC